MPKLTVLRHYDWTVIGGKRVGNDSITNIATAIAHKLNELISSRTLTIKVNDRLSCRCEVTQESSIMNMTYRVPTYVVTLRVRIGKNTMTMTVRSTPCKVRYHHSESGAYQTPMALTSDGSLLFPKEILEIFAH